MKRNFIKLLILTIILGSASLVSYQVDALDIIYGDDQRREVRDSSFSRFSKYLVAMVDIYDRKPIESYGKRKKLCHNSRFFSQPSISKCSGILVKGKYILTAAHCISFSINRKRAQIDCQEKGWILDYQTDNGASGEVSYQMVRCKSLVEFDHKNDYALIELNREQSQRRLAPKLAPSQLKDLANNSYTSLGFPSGLPMKSSDGSFIEIGANSHHNAFFNFDTARGSSGSPVLNQKGELLGILLSGKSDFTYNKDKGCYEVNKCDESGFNCSDMNRDDYQGEGVLLLSRLLEKKPLSRLNKLFSNHR